jgi:hypothetical protein
MDPQVMFFGMGVAFGAAIVALAIATVAWSVREIE